MVTGKCRDHIGFMEFVLCLQEQPSLSLSRHLALCRLYVEGDV